MVSKTKSTSAKDKSQSTSARSTTEATSSFIDDIFAAGPSKKKQLPTTTTSISGDKSKHPLTSKVSSSSSSSSHQLPTNKKKKKSKIASEFNPEHPLASSNQPVVKVVEIVDTSIPSSRVDRARKVESSSSSSNGGVGLNGPGVERGKKRDRKAIEEEEAFKDSRGTGPRRKTEEGFLIYKEAELGIDPEAGGTPLCPFDCDCFLKGEEEVRAVSYLHPMEFRLKEAESEV